MAHCTIKKFVSKRLSFILYSLNFQHYSTNYSKCNRKIIPIAKKSFPQNTFFIQSANYGYDCSKHQVQCRPKVKREDTFWESIFGRKKKKPPKETCRLLACQKCEFEEIPCFVQAMKEEIPRSSIQRTKGDAYILEVPSMHIPHAPKTQEEIIIYRMERDKDAPFKRDLCNPMPRFTTVGARLLDLQSRKLHPSYHKYEIAPRRRNKIYSVKCDYSKYKFGKEPEPTEKAMPNIHPRDKFVITEYKMADIPRPYRYRIKDHEVNLQSPLEVQKKKIRIKTNKKFSHLKECPPLYCSNTC